MELYHQTSYQTAKLFTEQYSTSFSTSSRLFASSIRQHIYAIYGLVRVADEIVDTYRGDDQLAQLNALEVETRSARKRGYSVNPLVHAFVLTAEKYNIDDSIVAPFFESMRMDVGNNYSSDLYDNYIHGSAEVVGLMCLKVFVKGDNTLYQALMPGALLLGSAYQKVNFLRDIKADHEIGRMYFPGVTYESFDDESKRLIEQDITNDFQQAKNYVEQLPGNARAAVRLSYEYYDALLQEIMARSAKDLKQTRIRVSDVRKLRLLMSARLRKFGDIE